MKRITLYRHPDCERCGRIARVHHWFDWLNRIEHSTAEPPAGPLMPGQIAAVDHATGRELRGVAAVRRVFRSIPAYLPLLPLLWVPAVARKIDRDLRGCEYRACAVPVQHGGQP
ncbi:MAG: hypothetical protein ABGY75_16075 [Gemmataceae bacterium]